MIPWPDNHRVGPKAEPEPVAPPGGQTTSPSPPPVETPSLCPVTVSKAPPLPRPTSPLLEGVVRLPRRSFGLVVALIASAAVHAAALSWIGNRVPQPGMEAASDAVTIEIILEAPPAPPVEPVQGEATSDQQTEPAISPETPVPAEPAETEMATAKPPEELEPIAPDTRAPPQAPMPDPAATQPTQTDGEPAAQPEAVAPQPQEEELSAPVVLPSADIPVPTPRPQPQQAKSGPSAKAKGAEPKPARPRTKAKAPAPGAERAVPAKNAQPAPANPSAGRKGGATAGEKAAYSRRLLAHVERYKRYPQDAARDGLSGAAGLSITIDRNGNLAGARLTKSSGHAIFDQEAMAVARRAAPFPRPPEGIGGNTISFSVTLRFKR